MDIARGPRRARNVAANAASAAARSGEQGTETSHPTATGRAAPPSFQPRAGGNDASPPNEPPPPPQQRRIRRQRFTPDTRRTPDQGNGQEGDGSVPAAPPVNPFRLHRIARGGGRLSMPEVSDDSDSEPDISILGMTRGQQVPVEPQDHIATYEDEVMSQEQYEAEDTSVEDDIVEEEQVEEENEVEDEQEVIPLIDPATMGLKEISNLGKFTVSSHKPGSGVEELRSDDLKLYWQSDGPQPHKLTVYFVKRVGIREIRFYVDYHEDESYTPTKIVFKSGISENNLIEFATMNLDNPVGWQQVPLTGAGGDPDGNTLVSYVLQMQILENHQNGKDTHLRGIKIYAFDAEAASEAKLDDDSFESMIEIRARAMREAGHHGDEEGDQLALHSQETLAEIARALAATRLEPGEGGLSIPDFMREPELR